MSFIEAPRHFIQVGSLKLQLELDGPNEQSKQVALRELRETPENVAKGLTELRELLAAEEGLDVPTDDDTLMAALRPCKFYAKSARDLMVNCCKLKWKYTVIYKDLLPSKSANALTSDLITVLVNRDQLGRRIIVQRMGAAWDTRKVSIGDINRGIALLVYALMCEPDTQINGAVTIFDMNGMNFSHVTAISPAEAKTMVNIASKGVPVRVKAFHYINNPKIFEAAHKVFKPFLGQKLRSRVFIHGNDMTSLHKYIAPECLPAEFGGSSPTPIPSGVDWTKLFKMYENEFKIFNSWGYTKSPK